MYNIFIKLIKLLTDLYYFSTRFLCISIQNIGMFKIIKIIQYNKFDKYIADY